MPNLTANSILPVAILAGGLATRMRPHTERIPKALLDLNGEPFIAHQLRLLVGQGVTNVVLCTAHLGEMIADYVGNGHQFGCHVCYSQDGEKLMGTAGALKRALPMLGEAFFVMYGDSYLPCDFSAIQQTFLQSRRQALMTVYKNQGLFDASNVEYADGEIRVYDKKLVSPKLQHIDYGLELFQARAFDAVPSDQPQDLASLLQSLLTQGQLASYEVLERFYEIGSLQGWQETAAYLQTRVTQERKPA